jgi:hypothetical protein
LRNDYFHFNFAGPAFVVSDSHFTVSLTKITNESHQCLGIGVLHVIIANKFVAENLSFKHLDTLSAYAETPMWQDSCRLNKGEESSAISLPAIVPDIFPYPGHTRSFENGAIGGMLGHRFHSLYFLSNNP